jgi:hypothetical protein
MKPIILIPILSLLHFFIFNSYSQGCSDAGFCSLNAFKAKQNDSMYMKFQNEFKFGGSYGKADHEIDVLAGFIEYHKDVDSCSSFDIRMTFTWQENDLVRSYGPSDIFMNANWSVAKDVIVTTGCKLPLTVGNANLNGSYLPMDFQHSIGTFDVILGIGYKIKGFNLFLAGQQPLNKSKNKFLKESYPPASPFREYQSTNSYRRRGDIMLRVVYPYMLNNWITVTPGVLPIYHIADDQFINVEGEKETIVGSKGLTLNANLFVDFVLNRRSKFTLSFGVPLVVRDVRPDGLTRKFVAGLDYGVRF